MILTLVRFESDNHDTLGLFFINKSFVAFTLEDRKNLVKIKDETRIPSGTYKIAYTYSPKYDKFMLQVMNVPQFEGIRIHPGNTEKDTSGCLLLGNVCRFNPEDSGDCRIEESTLAYERVSKLIIDVLGKEDVVLVIKDAIDV